MRLAVAYMRYSSDNQNETSIEYQRNKISEYCARNRIRLVNEYVDEAYSGTNDMRPGFQGLMNAARAKPEWDTVLIYDYSRFCRNMSDAVRYKNLLKDHDINLISVTQDFGNSNESFMMEGVIDLINDFYSRNNAKVTHDGMKVKAAKAGHCGGIPPLGYDLGEDGQLIINDHEAEAIHLIFNMVEQNCSYAQIAEYLNKNGYRTKEGNLFSKTSFSSILQREKYAGTYVWNKTRQKNSKGKRNSHAEKPIEQQVRIEGGCPQIISPEQLQRVQEKLAGRARGKAESKARHHYMLGGLKILRCAGCGAYMVGNPKTSHGKKYFTYACPNHKGGGCTTKEIRAVYVNRMVAWVIVNDLYRRKDLPRLSQSMQEATDLGKLGGKKRGIEKKIQNIAKCLEQRPSETLVEQLGRLEEQKETVDQEILRCRARMVGITKENRKDVCKKFARYLVKANDPDVKSYLKNVLQEVVVSNESVTVKMKVE